LFGLFGFNLNLIEEYIVLSIKKVIASSLVSVFVLSATLFAGTISADSGQAELQLAQLSDGFSAETSYMASCFACHSSGAAGAPKVGPGNAEAWAPRVEKGMDVLVTNAISGFNVMPPKGLCFTCTDDDLRAIVQYMVDSSK
jgi:cytochrome c5